MVEIRSLKAFTMYEHIDYEVNKLWRTSCLENAPASFFVCREARGEILRCYDRLQRTKDRSPAVYFNFGIDIIYLPYEFFHLNIKEFLVEFDLSRKVSRLMVNTDLLFNNQHEQWDSPAEDLCDFSNIK